MFASVTITLFSDCSLWFAEALYVSLSFGSPGDNFSVVRSCPCTDELDGRR